MDTSRLPPETDEPRRSKRRVGFVCAVLTLPCVLALAFMFSENEGSPISSLAGAETLVNQEVIYETETGKNLLFTRTTFKTLRSNEKINSLSDRELRKRGWDKEMDGTKMTLYSHTTTNDYVAVWDIAPHRIVVINKSRPSNVLDRCRVWAKETIPFLSQRSKFDGQAIDKNEYAFPTNTYSLYSQ